MRRFAQVIGVKPERVDDYEAIHAVVWPEVLSLIRQANIRNYSIFRHGSVLFAYFEYVGVDLDGDMKALSDHPVNREWWKLTDPMQVPVPDHDNGEWWKNIPEVFHTD